MRSLSTWEPKSFLIGFKVELPSTTFNPGMPSFISVKLSWLTQSGAPFKWPTLGEGGIPAVPLGTHDRLITNTLRRLTWPTCMS